ncbi:alpha/beta hydrolase family protein [Ramlibacter albus]|uniref:Alpha/beta hydrolase n=1 Tax=Ramlibacter albus TaxID=2079448 RepID=A0A923M8X1_9BURK|nr:hypothetical protein [Ramlibacter albus]MBC5764934.1 hypothetical protein [Ramlibacter albus]
MKYLAVLPVFLALAAHAQRVPFPTGDAHFTAEQASRGVQATEQECAKVSPAVWARAAGGAAECIRYWFAGFDGDRAKSVVVYMPGDQLVGSGVDPSYTRRRPSDMQKIAHQMQTKLGTPFLLLTRPGIFGSSGTHRERRREPEARLMQAAVDAIKQKHGIEEFALVGQSGGGHTVASLLGWRQDIACAVPTSAVSSPRARWEVKGFKRDLTGFSDSYEPVEHLQPGAFHPKLRVFVLGDPRDSNTPWETQQPLARKLKSLGVATELVEGEGADGERHHLGASGQLLGALCLKGATTKEILDVAAKGLKG